MKNYTQVYVKNSFEAAATYCKAFGAEITREYYKALNESNRFNECTPFVTFMLEVIRDALAEILQNQKAFIPTNDGKNVGRKVAGDVGINRDVVIKILKKQPHATAKSLAEAMNLSPRQVERVLAELKKEGKIVRRGSNKSGWWEVN